MGLGKIDWIDIGFVFFLSIVFILFNWGEHIALEGIWHFIVENSKIALFLLCVSYITIREIFDRNKLRIWGISTPITLESIMWAFVLWVIGIAILVVSTWMLGGKLSFRVHYLYEMFLYIFFAFPQQFVFCSVVLVSLSTFSFFQNHLRLALCACFLFSLAHFWTTPLIPGIGIPIEMALTLFGGFFAAIYFLKFRTVIPIIIIHAILHPLLHNWIEIYLE